MWLLLHGANLSLQCISQVLYRERVCECRRLERKKMMLTLRRKWRLATPASSW